MRKIGTRVELELKKKERNIAYSIENSKNRIQKQIIPFNPRKCFSILYFNEINIYEH